MSLLELYNNYSNEQLLKIVKRPDGYQPEAIEIAKKILETRAVTIEEHQEVEEYFNKLDQKTQRKKDKTELYKRKALDLIDPILHPTEKFTPGRWLNLLLLFIAIQCIWIFYNSIKGVIDSFGHSNFHYMIVVQTISLLYVLLIFYLLFKKRKWGWILLFSDNLFMIFSYIGRLNMAIIYPEFTLESTPLLLFWIVMRIIFLVFLWRPVLTDFFHVPKRTKWLTLLIVGVGTISMGVFIGLMASLF